MLQSIEDAVWSILKEHSAVELRSLPTEAVSEIIEDVHQGRMPEEDEDSGGFGFGGEALVEHVVLGVHIALAIVHSVMLLRHHHGETEMLKRLEAVANALDDKLQLTDEIVEKLKAIDPS